MQTNKDFLNEYENATKSENIPSLPNLAALAYDAVWLSAMALHETDLNNSNLLCDFNYNNNDASTTSNLAYQYALKTEFAGASVC